MFQLPAFHILCSWLGLCLALLACTTTIATTLIAKPGCETKCGNITIPYPYGIGLDGACSLSQFYIISCNNTKPFIGTGNLEVVDISIITGQISVKNFVAANYFHGGNRTKNYVAEINLHLYPIVFSDTENKLTLIGCDDYVYFYGIQGKTFKSGCIAGCPQPQDAINGSCTGIGCCQTSIPKGLEGFEIYINSFSNHTNVSYFNPYSYAFLGKQDAYEFKVADLSDPSFLNRTQEHVPVVIDWFVGMNLLSSPPHCIDGRQN